VTRSGANQFQAGRFATIYLSPKDYHRVHMPLTGTLREMIYVPGKLFSVNQTTADNIAGLFARNERVVCIFDTKIGPMAMVLVGAMIVASIDTVWAGSIAPADQPVTVDYRGGLPPITLEKGMEMGRFKLGSTVIMVFAEDSMQWKQSLDQMSAIRMGEAIGQTSSDH
jgi:phosphatidylserine decarboxylase